jgi:hypothetical protein
MGSSKKHKDKDREHKHKRKHRSRDRSRSGSRERRHRDREAKDKERHGEKRRRIEAESEVHADYGQVAVASVQPSSPDFMKKDDLAEEGTVMIIVLTVIDVLLVITDSAGKCCVSSCTHHLKSFMFLYS